MCLEHAYSLSKFANRLITLLGLGRHRLHGDPEQFAGRIVLSDPFGLGNDDLISRNGFQTIPCRFPIVRWLAGEQSEQDGSQQVHVAVWPHQKWRIDHFRSHETRRASGRRIRGLPGANQNGKPPIQDQHLTESTGHDVLWLEITVNHPLGMGKRHRIADIDENLEVLVQRQTVDRLVPRLPLHVFHRIEEVTIGRFTHLVNRDDVGVLQSSSQNRFGQKLVPYGLLSAGMPVDRLQGHVTTQRDLSCQVNRPHATFTQHRQGHVIQVVLSGGDGQLHLVFSRIRRLDTASTDRVCLGERLQRLHPVFVIVLLRFQTRMGQSSIEILVFHRQRVREVLENTVDDHCLVGFDVIFFFPNRILDAVDECLFGSFPRNVHGIRTNKCRLRIAICIPRGRSVGLLFRRIPVVWWLNR